MSKVFRLYKEGTTTLQGWSENPAFPYNSNARETIESPDGDKQQNEITSIPSPFARIDLMKTAFKEICRRAARDINQLDGNTIFHKMISDTLDVGEIFFNIDKFKDKIEIITWNPSQMIPILKSDGNNSHKCVANALEKYLYSDARTYNFSGLRNIYLLNYINGPDELNIIGATSPATLFFSGANSLDYINDIFFANNDTPFDNNFQPLYKREFEYIKSWWTIRKSFPNFSTLFPEIESYLNLTFKAIKDQDVKNKLNEISASSTSDFDVINVQSYQENNQVEILGLPLFKKKNIIKGTNNEFTINADKKLYGSIPMVLPVESGNKYADLLYINGIWGNDNKAPYKAAISNIDERVLPFDGSVYPFLTISDFLEDSIVKVPHILNKKFYFDGNIDGGNELTFLLPIKPLYFKYFNVDTLRGKMPDGRSAFEMNVLAGGSVNVVIRIPIKGNDRVKYIEYKRTYYNNFNASDISETTNSGYICSDDFTGLVMPSMRFQNDADALYTISCVSAFSDNFSFDFFNDEMVIRDIPRDCRNKEKGFDAYKAVTYTLKGKNFDFIRVTNSNGNSNIIVPIFITHQNLDNFEFSVDFGTSNTHIEFKKADNPNSEPFNYTETEPIYSAFFLPSFREIKGKLYAYGLNEYTDLIESDYIPSKVGPGTDFSFPTRTVLSYAKSIDWNSNLRVFGLLNFNLTYHKRNTLGYNAPPMFNLKWSSKINAQSATHAYIENIMMLIRNKVIANNGNLAKTKISWFYPNSMAPRRLNQLKEAWNEIYKKLFNPDGYTRNISESVAPIEFYFKRYSTVTNLVNIDIGGGTTDIAFSSNGKVNYVTSFKFATNVLFEDSFSEINPHNGIVDYFKNDILSLLEADTYCSDLVNIFKSNIEYPSNMASFLFSLKDNSKTKEIAANRIDFDKILQDDSKFKIVFILFYTAIIYHIAQIVKTKGIKEPRHIAFSGNGSKIIRAITTDTTILSKLTKIIFEKVLGRPYDIQLDLLGFEKDVSPKETTCKGGLILKEISTDEPDNIVLKDSFGSFVEGKDTYASITQNSKKIVLDSVKDFFKFALVELPSEINLDKYFGVAPLETRIALEECTKDLETYLDKGIELSIRESGNRDNTIEEALMFYPIKGVIQALSSRIQECHLKEQV